MGRASPTRHAPPRDPEATRAAILQAARKLFAQKGYADTAISEIAREAGVTQSLIHHHFGAKADLWKAVRQHFSEQFTEAQLRHFAHPRSEQDAEALRSLAIERFHFMREHPEVVRMFTWRALEAQQELTEHDSRDLDSMRERIASLQRAGALRDDVRPEHVMVALTGVFTHWLLNRHLVLTWLQPQADAEQLDEEYLQAALKLFFEGLVPR